MRSLFITLTLLCAFATSLQGQTRLEYSYGPAALQSIDLCAAQSRTDGAAPILVMLHGGAWRFGDKRSPGVWEAKVRHWVPQGYVFISVNTRLLPDANPITQAQDLAAALAFVQRNAGQWGADADRLILMGHSAGAHVAGLLSTQDDLQRVAGVRPWRGTVVLDSAALDVVQLMRNAPIRAYRRAFGGDPGLWQEASPETHLDQGDPPFLIVCSAQRTQPCPVAQAFERTASALGVAVTVLPIELSHRQINTELGQASPYTRFVNAWIAAHLQ